MDENPVVASAGLGASRELVSVPLPEVKDLRSRMQVLEARLSDQPPVPNHPPLPSTFPLVTTGGGTVSPDLGAVVIT